MVIGATYYWNTVETDIIREHRPAVKSKLGNLLSQPVTNGNEYTLARSVSTISRIPDKHSLEQFWNLESLGFIDLNEPTTLVEILKDYQERCSTYENST